MALIPIILIPDPVLREVAKPVTEITDGVRQLLDDMVETMYEAPGIGLAAPQVNISQRLIVMDCGKDETPELFKMINPEIINRSAELAVLEEGCLSIPATFIEIERPRICEVEYIDIDGKIKNLKCDGLLSTCIQHEINHLDGKLIIDHLSKLKRDLIIKKISKSKKNPDRIVV